MKLKPKVGDIFAVELKNNKYALCQLAYQYEKDRFSGVIISDIVIDSLDADFDFNEQKIIGGGFFILAGLETGDLPIIKNIPPIDARPYIRGIKRIMQGDTLYTSEATISILFSFLNAYYGLEYWNKYADPNYLYQYLLNGLEPLQPIYMSKENKKIELLIEDIYGHYHTEEEMQQLKRLIKDLYGNNPTEEELQILRNTIKSQKHIESTSDQYSCDNMLNILNETDDKDLEKTLHKMADYVNEFEDESWTFLQTLFNNKRIIQSFGIIYFFSKFALIDWENEDNKRDFLINLIIKNIDYCSDDVAYEFGWYVISILEERKNKIFPTLKILIGSRTLNRKLAARRALVHYDICWKSKDRNEEKEYKRLLKLCS